MLAAIAANPTTSLPPIVLSIKHNFFVVFKCPTPALANEKEQVENSVYSLCERVSLTTSN
jgi:hypothetical protein